MTPLLGVLAALVAFFGWGFGEFSIQRASRAVGPTAALFFITAFGTIVLFPFVLNDFSLLTQPTVLLLLCAILITILAALLVFEALKRGKIAVIEPVVSFELLVTVAIGVILLREPVSALQLLFIGAVFIGILLTVVRTQPKHWWEFWRRHRGIEKGVLFAAVGSVIVGAMNVLTGLSSQATNPVFAIWFIHAGITVLVGAWLLATQQFIPVLHNARRHWRVVLAESVFDNAAWIAFNAAVLVLPISITIAITEGYIALAALLGIVVNKERLQRHQSVGVIVTLLAVITLAVLTG